MGEHSSARTLATDFQAKRNSLNAIRLVLALTVVVSHAWPLGGYGDDPFLGRTAIAHLAVMGFFAISGYLITGSRGHYGNGRYLWHRFLRILPAFWVCLVAMAFVFAPIAYLVEHGTLGGFSVLSAAEVIGSNFFLRLVDDTIAGTLENNPYGPAWNGSLWTLSYEFYCYLLVAMLFTLRMMRPWVVTTILAVCAIALTVESVLPGSITSEMLLKLLWTLAMFASGSLLYLLRDRVPNSWPVALAALAVTAVGLYALAWPQGVIGLPIAYLMIWLGIRLPLHNLTGRADFSYGTYIYAYPVAQLLVVFGLHRLGIPLYIALTVAITGVLAIFSWYVVESRALRFKGTPAPWKRPASTARGASTPVS